VAALLGASDFLVHDELVRECPDLLVAAATARDQHASDLAMAVRATERGGHMRVELVIARDGSSEELTRTAFLAGDEGRRRSALAAVAALWQSLDQPKS
jgi:hypothetical protein